MSNFNQPAQPQLADKDRAETFDESDVSLSGNVSPTGGSLGIENQNETLTRTADDTTTSNDGRYGVTINPNQEISRLEFEPSENAADVTTAYIRESGAGADLATASLSDGKFTFDLLDSRLQAGTDYHLHVDAGGATYSLGIKSGQAYPVGGSILDILAGHSPSTGTVSDNAYNVQNIYAEVLRSSASATVGWPQPEDVYAWDRATFKRTTPGSTSVEVFVEEEQSGGWVEVAGPLSRGDAIPASSENRVRFRVEFDRTGEPGQNPTLDSIYRRWVL